MVTEQEAVLAFTFTEVLGEWLTDDQFDEMRRRNVSPEYADGACASHDFCDANMAMLEAFKRVVGRAPDLAEDADVNLWDNAWNEAHAQFLTERE